MKRQPAEVEQEAPRSESIPTEPHEPEASSGRGLRAEALAVAIMVLGLLAIYCPPYLFGGKQSLQGIDYGSIHERRIRYAQEALGTGTGGLPAWYSRELMGTPFWSNIQSFPFVPSRLALLWIDPEILYPVAVNLAAVLAALFTYLYLRRVGIGRVASTAGGWTFAASGYFASRVLAGHLPLLEAFASLPLLLWCVESIARSDPHWRKYVGLALASLCVVLCGHPQVPAYAMGTAMLYAVVRLRGRSALRTLSAMALGIGLSGFAWWPMLKLIGRSTRILPLDRPGNDLPLPYWRLKAFLLPWADGWPNNIDRLPEKGFADPNFAYFWDTVCYVGWIPLIAAIALAVRSIWRRRWPERPWLLLALVAVGAVALALPLTQSLTGRFHVTLLRSPSRLLYLTTFGLAVALALGLHEALRSAPRTKKRLGIAAVGGALVVHALDLRNHDQWFLRPIERLPRMTQEVARWRENLGPQRFAFDYNLRAPANRAVDDAGFFDSIMLARPYRAFTALNRMHASVNVQDLDASTLPVPALAGLGVRFVITPRKRDDLQLIEVREFASSYKVPDPLPRVTFFPDASVVPLDDAAVLERFRNGAVDFKGRMFLAPLALPPDHGKGPGASSPQPPAITYDRPDSDHIVVRSETVASGYVRIMESWDEGWSATLDGRPADLLVADTFAMAVRVGPGRHELRCTNRTPGKGVGWSLSALSAALLALLAFRLRS